MFWNTFLTVFITVFLAELGDKTQLATFLFASKSDTSRWAVWMGASAALVVAATAGVLVGAQAGRFIPERGLKIAAGLGFIAIGVWTLLAKA